MPTTQIPTGLQVQRWSDQIFHEYVSSSPLARYLGKSPDSVIQLLEQLTKETGDRIVFSLVYALAGPGRTGSQVLEGFEEAMDTRSHAVTVNMLRNGVLIDAMEAKRAPFDPDGVARTQLRNWATRRLTTDIVEALLSIDGVPYTSASATQKNTWLVNNSDRVRFGGLIGNQTAVHSTSLANVAATDTLTPKLISQLRDAATAASPAINPVSVGTDGEEVFVLFAGSRSMRDLRNDPVMVQANRDAAIRGRDNPVFAAGDLIYGGVLIRELTDIPVLPGVGAGGIDVQPALLCGRQAVGVAWGQRPELTTEVRDYGFSQGVALAEIRGIEKLRFGTGPGDTDNPVDHGIVTAYMAASPDA